MNWHPSGLTGGNQWGVISDLIGEGKRNSYLNHKALAVSHEILALDSKSAQWIARDAIGELESDAVRKRLVNK